MFIFFFFNDTATTEIYTLSYTTLFRSKSAPGSDQVFFAAESNEDFSALRKITPSLSGAAALWIVYPKGQKRSEEHTSELQSQSNLVCRLLLEKKNHID